MSGFEDCFNIYIIFKQILKSQLTMYHILNLNKDQQNKIKCFYVHLT